MGLRDLFRSKKNDTPTPQPAPGARPVDPAAAPQSAQGAPEAPQQAQENALRRHDPNAVALPESGALRNLVELLLSRGADRARLTLVQSGNIMTHQTRQAVGDAQDEVENGTVDQGSPLFDDVADLYTQAMNTPVGPWRQLDLIAANPHDGQREITVTYDFPNGESRTEQYVHGAPAEASQHDPVAGASVVDGALAQDSRPAAGTVPADTAQVDDDAVRVVPEHGPSEPAENGEVLTAGHAAPVVAEDTDPAPVVEHEQSEPAAPVVQDESLETPAVADRDAAELTAQQEEAEQLQRSEPLDERGQFEQRESALAAEPVAQTTEDRPEVIDATEERATETEESSPEDLPAHVDESEFGMEPAENLVPAASAQDTEDDPASAPQVALATDVAPSYRGAEPEQRLDPDALSPGNLALTMGDVISRLADAQRHLFDSEGTARDVSTVLIRVRALGTYYDALTHVRLNGFWDQRPTFELVPEDLLKVQELKDDSYVEGSGAPLAMMFRFRPGVPPEVTFDYSDEEAFVRYEQRLPGQNYLEELRMYPRTGSNIPEHVNEALQDWNY
ncbi:hypothetical protein [Kocuria marina]|uniref:Uncharacterized protein n=1 Tax=Kocuria marina subsp. indica TaxID=1049583 RepID=A0A1X7DA31_9MICC|nr:hypothetical protein [Kocuria indica]OXS82836.1 hypothetical protein B1B07_07655 [Kocuria indica]RLP57693.1 hypothetical protein D9R06_08475 [Kocuria indica]SMF11613.1 hypothetical protein SAMN06296028_11021 [Kocuria indica]